MSRGFGLLVIGFKGGASFLIQSCSVVDAKSITFRRSNENYANALVFLPVTASDTPLKFVSYVLPPTSKLYREQSWS